MQQLRKTLNPKPTEDWFWVDLERKKEKTLPSFEFFSCFFPFFFLLFSSFFYFSLLPCFCFALILCLLVGFLPFVHGQQQAQVFFWVVVQATIFNCCHLYFLSSSRKVLPFLFPRILFFIPFFCVLGKGKKKKNMRGGRRKSEKEMKKDKKTKEGKKKVREKGRKITKEKKGKKKKEEEEEDWISFCIFFFFKHLCNVACCLVFF